jgi:hypothetical protein
MLAGPGEGLFVGGSGEDLTFQVVVINSEELAGPKIHAEAKVGEEFRVKGVRLSFTDLVAHAGEINDPLKFIAGGAWHFVTV